MRKKEIKINCKGTHYFSLCDLHILQDTSTSELKNLDKSDFEKLKNRIEKKGFWFPFFVWHCKKEKKWYYTDGTQRHKVLTWMKDSGRYKLPKKFPAVEIYAKNKKEAAEAILTQSSRYGRMTEQGLSIFNKSFDLDFRKMIEDINFDFGHPSVEDLTGLSAKQMEEKSLVSFKKTHILISFNPKHFVKIQDFIYNLQRDPDFEIEQGSN